MKITLFTSDKTRHNYLIKLLSQVCKTLFVVQEKSKNLSKTIPDNYIQSKITNDYFKKVNIAQKKYLGRNTMLAILKIQKILNIQSGSLSKISINKIDDFLKSDVYVVFGSSYIKNELVDFLIKKGYKYSYGNFSIL